MMLVLNGLTPTPAFAAPNFSIIVSKDESIVMATGFAAGDTVTVDVERNGVRIGRATGLTAAGAFEVNHAALPATQCWDVFTPEILAGDVVRVTSTAALGAVTFTDTVAVADIEITDGATRVDADTGTVKGRIIASPLPAIDTLSVETRNLGEPRFRGLAPGASEGVQGTLVYDTGPGALPGSFTATFDGFSAGQMGAFLDSTEVVASVVAADVGGNLSATSAVFEAVADPGDALCPPTARRAVTTFSEGAINIANQGAALAISGVSVAATAVNATVTDRFGQSRTTPAATLGGAGVSQTWQTSLAADQLTGLADGPLLVAATYTEEGGSLHGANRTILKDTVAPAAPAISPDGGSFTGSRQIDITAPDADIMYTLDGTTPSALNGVPFGGPITLADSATLRAVAIDAFGNIGPVSQAVFTQLAPPASPAPQVPQAPPAPPAPPAPQSQNAPPAITKVPGAPKIGPARAGARGGRVTATARWSAPRLDGGSSITGYVVTALRMVDGKVRGRTTIRLPGTARSVQMKLGRGTYRFQLRAVNAVGRSPLSARSNIVRAR